MRFASNLHNGMSGVPVLSNGKHAYTRADADKGRRVLAVLAYAIASLSPNMDFANAALPAYTIALLFFAG